MTPPTDTSYTAQALRTESPITPALQTRLRENPRLVHAVLGLLTEAGELADPVKKHIYYGRPLDPVNLREEIGDCLWYLAIVADALGTTLEAEQARNLAKLRARYPHVFTAEAAQVRDLDRERQVLEAADVDKTLEPAQATEKQHQAFRVWQQQFDDAHAIIVSRLEQELDDARSTILSQKRGNQYLWLLINKVRGIVTRDDAMSDRLGQIASAIDDFDHGTLEPAQATEPAPESNSSAALGRGGGL